VGVFEGDRDREYLLINCYLISGVTIFENHTIAIIKMHSTINKTNPFLRWAGGKRWFLKHMEEITLCKTFNNYHEPFLGSGAVFFHLKPPNSSYLSDLNNELIETFIAVRDEVDNIIEELKRFKNTQEEYYRIRECKFQSDYKRAARFIYLNQTSYNGIYRVNLKGVYNVPFGFRNTQFFQPENLRSTSELLQKSIIETKDFGNITKYIEKNDLLFLDPPYTISHNNNGFIKYNQKLFSLEDQYRLSTVIDEIKKRNAFYILTNAAHDTIEQIFEKGDKKLKIKRASLIGGQNAIRGKFEEIIFTNII
jgi:DNA adenine methylase